MTELPVKRSMCPVRLRCSGSLGSTARNGALPCWGLRGDGASILGFDMLEFLKVTQRANSRS